MLVTCRIATCDCFPRRRLGQVCPWADFKHCALILTCFVQVHNFTYYTVFLKLFHLLYNLHANRCSHILDFLLHYMMTFVKPLYNSDWMGTNWNSVCCRTWSKFRVIQILSTCSRLDLRPTWWLDSLNWSRYRDIGTYLENKLKTSPLCESRSVCCRTSARS